MAHNEDLFCRASFAAVVFDYRESRIRPVPRRATPGEGGQPSAGGQAQCPWAVWELRLHLYSVGQCPGHAPGAAPSGGRGLTTVRPAREAAGYGNGVLLVGFGLDEQLREPVEVHCYYTTGFLITLRRAPSPALDALRQARSVPPRLGSDPIRALHPVISSLYTQFSALVLELDQRLDALEQRVLREADDEELAEITAIRHRAAVIRRILTPGRDLAARTPLIQSLPGATSETRLYAEDISDELQQVVADFTAIEERCIALLGLHAALASKHVASVSRRLAAVATIFLPISFLAGFWGENFNVLTGRVEQGWPAFLVLGVGLNVACVVVIVVLLSRRSWN
jgi:magnesium transporter